MGASRLLELFFPRRCPFCGGIEPSDLPCGACQKTLPWLGGAAAGSRVEHIEDHVFSALVYQGAVRDAVLGLKFHGKVARAKPLGVLIAQCAQDHLPGGFDLVSYPPISAKRLRRRGYDQAQRLAREVARAYGMKETGLLEKTHRPAQSTLADAAARRANILGAYRVKDPRAVAGKRILLVDDVVTTGSTLSECARVLRTAGAEAVYAVTLAKAGPQRYKSGEKPCPQGGNVVS